MCHGKVNLIIDNTPFFTVAFSIYQKFSNFKWPTLISSKSAQETTNYVNQLLNNTIKELLTNRLLNSLISFRHQKQAVWKKKNCHDFPLNIHFSFSETYYFSVYFAETTTRHTLTNTLSSGIVFTIFLLINQLDTVY